MSTTINTSRLHTYRVELGSGSRTVLAESKLDAVVNATGREASRFTAVGVGEYKETACAPGHQGIYHVRLNSRRAI
jgi:hypothetical protein